eukprot:4595582-Amphidinium_carterae.1
MELVDFCHIYLHHMPTPRNNPGRQRIGAPSQLLVGLKYLPTKPANGELQSLQKLRNLPPKINPRVLVARTH